MSPTYSDAALRVLFVKESMRLTAAQFWKGFPDARTLSEKTEGYQTELNTLAKKFPAVGADGMACAFDESFPALNSFVPEGERPFLLFYRGDLSLLEDLNRNVAVIGAIDPDANVVEREKNIVSRLVSKGLVIVSGLANGCDAEAHRACLATGGKTIAILPSQMNKIYPAKNRGLAEEIVENGGLLLTEYAGEPAGRNAALKRFIDRDRLQAMFSKAVLMIASHRRGEGDSGSRHAMEAAKKYRIGRYVMFDPKQDAGKSLFGLNQDLLRLEPDVKTLCRNSIEALASSRDAKLHPEITGEQIRLDMQ